MNEDFIDTGFGEIPLDEPEGSGTGNGHDKPLPFTDMSKWDDVPAPPRHWLVYDRIPRRQPTLFTGHGEAGKSTLMLQLLCSTVLSRDWIGFMPEPGPAIYLGAEEEEDELHRRLDPILKHHGARYADLVAGGFKLLSYAGKDMVLGIIDRQGRVQATDLYHRLYREACARQPKLVAIDGLSDIYVGNERERSQVRQFMGLFRRLGIDADCAPVITAHPSLAGMREGHGYSGTTQWFNSIRAQMYLKTASEDAESDEDDTADDDGLRELQFLKNQYGRHGMAVRLQWKDGLYLPVPSQSTLDALAAERKADDLFLKLLRRHASQGRNVTDKKGTSYAPAIFAAEPEAKKAKITNKALTEAMTRLFAANKIRIVTEGPASKQRTKIVEANGDETATIIPFPPPSTKPSTAVPPPSSVGGSAATTERERDAKETSMQSTQDATPQPPSTNSSSNLPPSSTNLPPLSPHTPLSETRGQEDLESPPPRPESEGSRAASVPFMLTRAMKEQLRQCGLTDDKIANITPQQAQDIIRERLPASDYRGTDNR